MPATPTLESQVAELTKQGATLAEAVDTVVKTLGAFKEKLDKPDFSGLHAGEGSLAYWDHGGMSRRKTVIRQGLGYEGMRAPFGAPPGYKNEVFKTFGGFLQSGMKEHKHSEWQAKHASVFKTIQGMSEQVASDGGYLILPEFNQTIMERVYDNALFAQLDQYTVAGNNMTFRRNAEVSRANGSRHGGLRGYWTDEGQSVTDTKPTFKSMTLRLKKLAIVVYLTQELLDDAGQSLEQYVVKKAQEEFNFMLGDAIFNGIGGGMPLGFLNSGALISVAKESGQLADTIVTENIDKMWQRRHSNGNYRWYKNRDTEAQLAGMLRGVGAAGELVYNPPGGVSSAPYATLKGVPAEDTEFNPTLGDQGDIVLADPSQIVAITKGGINQAVSTHVEFLTDQTAVRLTMRVDFRPWEDSPVTPYKGSNTQSAFVALDAR